MSRPTLEVADIIRAAGNSFWEQHSRILHGRIARCSMPSCVAAPRHWAVIAISASAAAIRPSRSTRAAIGTAPSARGTRAPNGWPRARLNCCPFLTSTSSSLCRMNFPLWSSRTSGCSTICSTAPAPQRCSNWLAIRSTWERISDSSAFSIPGDRTFEHHPHVHYIVPAGGLALDGSRWIDSSRRFFLPVHALSRVFRGKFIAGLNANSSSREAPVPWLTRAVSACSWRFPTSSDSYCRQDWVVYAKPPFGGAEHVLNYLARYTHRVAISNHRLVTFENGQRLIPLARLCARRQEEGHDRFRT